MEADCCRVLAGQSKARAQTNKRHSQVYMLLLHAYFHPVFLPADDTVGAAASN
jgi:hypothetical protein